MEIQFCFVNKSALRDVTRNYRWQMFCKMLKKEAKFLSLLSDVAVAFF